MTKLPVTLRFPPSLVKSPITMAEPVQIANGYDVFLHVLIQGKVVRPNGVLHV